MLEISEKYKQYLYFVFRLLVGWMFFEHGAGKLFGWFGGNKVSSLMSLFGVAGIIEVIAGLLVLVGLFVKLAALLSAGQMLVAYFIIHFPKSWDPLVNKGELALLYLVAFLVLYAWGAGKFSLERQLFGKEFF